MASAHLLHAINLIDLTNRCSEPLTAACSYESTEQGAGSTDKRLRPEGVADLILVRPRNSVLPLLAASVAGLVRRYAVFRLGTLGRWRTFSRGLGAVATSYFFYDTSCEAAHLTNRCANQEKAEE